ncbi:hypothetical protein [Mucilaginibacter flavidus]|uniref:hypothetical protein n=1 Tax=Mucilaginibacter flavidus TaxID=2949309 RepID=UPI00209397D3|nr:hypothetical protein [Mucilaginibacter flavidus]MCO5947519.1 hypothetical protein [Mucilaginibacter flavidus]
MKKKSKITLTVFMFNIIIFPGCEKAVVYNGNISVTLKYNQQAVPDIYIYYYSGIPLKDSSGNT